MEGSARNVPNICEVMEELKDALGEVAGLLREAIGLAKNNGSKEGVEKKKEKTKEQGKNEAAGARAEGLTPLVTDRRRDAREEGTQVREGSGIVEKEGQRRGSSEEDEIWRREMKVRETRKNNVTIKGLNVAAEGFLAEVVEEWVEKMLGKKAAVEGIEEKRCGQRGKIIIVRMKREEDVAELLSRQRDIEERERVWVDRDLTFTERGTRWIVKERAREEKRAGKEVLKIGEGWLRVRERKGKGGAEEVKRLSWNERQRTWQQTVEKTDQEEITKKAEKEEWAEEEEEIEEPRESRQSAGRTESRSEREWYTAFN